METPFRRWRRAAPPPQAARPSPQTARASPGAARAAGTRARPARTTGRLTPRAAAPDRSPSRARRPSPGDRIVVREGERGAVRVSASPGSPRRCSVSASARSCQIFGRAQDGFGSTCLVQLIELEKGASSVTRGRVAGMDVETGAAGVHRCSSPARRHSSASWAGRSTPDPSGPASKVFRFEEWPCRVYCDVDVMPAWVSVIVGVSCARQTDGRGAVAGVPAASHARSFHAYSRGSRGGTESDELPSKATVNQLTSRQREDVKLAFGAPATTDRETGVGKLRLSVTVKLTLKPFRTVACASSAPTPASVTKTQP